MALPPLRVIVTGALVVLALFAAARWVAGRSDGTSEALSHSITTPIDLAARTEAEANVRSALPAVQIYFTDHGSYAGISSPALRAIDPGLSPAVEVFATAGGYCLMATVRGVSVRNVGPGAGTAEGSCV